LGLAGAAESLSIHAVVELRSALKDFSRASSALSCAITFQRAMSGCSSSRSMAPLLLASHSSST
jgi:hypothetical protein